MSQHGPGKRIAVTPARAVVLELLHHARKAPSLPLAKTMNLEVLLEPRKSAGVSWTALFLKAYGLTALEHPELSRAFIPYPRKHFYEHPHSNAAVLVERDWQGENVVLGGRLRAPEERALVDIDVTLRE